MTKQKNSSTETDSVYFLKLVLYVVLGSLWLKFVHPLRIGDFLLNGFPLGLIIGLVFARYDHFQVDRKIEYAILLMATIVSFFLPSGILI
jgi:hypothetical protein